MAAKIQSILFILFLIAGTSIDFILRQMYPNQTAYINYACLGSFVICGLLLLAILSNHEFAANAEIYWEKEEQSHSDEGFLRSFAVNDPFLMVRFFAAFLVFITHMMILLKPEQQILSQSFGLLKGAAHQGMAIFFTLSGYLMCKAFLTRRYALTRQGILDFYKSRWIRIFPLMAFVLFFLSVLQYPELFRFAPESVFRLLIFNYYGNTIGLNGIGDMWSLSVEFQYYIIAPLLFFLLNGLIIKNKPIGLILLSVIIAMLLIGKFLVKKYALEGMVLYDPMYFSLVGNLPFFLIGFFFNYIKIRKIEKLASSIINSTFVFVFFCVLYIGCIKSNDYILISIVSGLLICCLDGIRNTNLYRARGRFCLVSILQAIGILSYGFYLWHSGIGYVHAKLFPNGFSSISAYIWEITFIAVIVLITSAVSFALVEFPINKYKPKHNQGKRPGRLQHRRSGIAGGDREKATDGLATAGWNSPAE